MTRKQRRQDRIRELLARNQVQSQAQILALLATEGVETTQATLSRDLRDLGVAKRGEGYELPESRVDVAAQRRQLAAVRSSIERVDRGGTVAVATTKHGQAPAVASALMLARLHGVIGIIAGLDQVFIATQTSAQSRGIVGVLSH